MMRALAAVHGCGVLVPLSLNLLSCTTEDIDVPDGGAGGTVTVAAASSETSGSGGSSSNATNTSASSTTGAEMCDLSDACEPVVIATPEILEFSESDSFAGGYFSYGDGVSNEVTADEEWHVSGEDRKSTRLNSSHVKNSYAVFCLNKNNNIEINDIMYTIYSSWLVCIYTP